MNDIDFKKAIRDLKKVELSLPEKRAMLARIMTGRETSSGVQETLIKSPWSLWPRNWFMENAKLSLVVAIVVILLAGNGVVSASSASLPGDLLYSVKVHIAEPLQVALTFSPQAKAKLVADQALERVQEGAVLAARGQLDPMKQAELSDLIAVHTVALNQELMAISSTSPQKAENIGRQFRASMKESADQLDALSAVYPRPQSAPVVAAAVKPRQDKKIRPIDQPTVQVMTTGASAVAPASENNDNARPERSRRSIQATTLSTATTTPPITIPTQTPTPTPAEAAPTEVNIPVLNLAASARSSGDQVPNYGRNDQGDSSKDKGEGGNGDNTNTSSDNSGSDNASQSGQINRNFNKGTDNSANVIRAERKNHKGD